MSQRRRSRRDIDVRDAKISVIRLSGLRLSSLPFDSPARCTDECHGIVEVQVLPRVGVISFVDAQPLLQGGGAVVVLWCRDGAANRRGWRQFSNMVVVKLAAWYGIHRTAVRLFDSASAAPAMSARRAKAVHGEYGHVR